MKKFALAVLILALFGLLSSEVFAQCVDSDGGIDYNTKGVCTGRPNRYTNEVMQLTDQCITPQNNLNEDLTEYACRVQGNIETCTPSGFKCEYGCKDGACLSKINNELKSDLTIESAIFFPENPAIGDEIKIKILVANTGDVEAKKVYVSIGDQMSWGNDGTISLIMPKKKEEIQISLYTEGRNENRFLENNPHKFIVKVDQNNIVDEYNEANNQIEKTIFIQKKGETNENAISIQSQIYTRGDIYQTGTGKAECDYGAWDRNRQGQEIIINGNRYTCTYPRQYCNADLMQCCQYDYSTKTHFDCTSPPDYGTVQTNGCIDTDNGQNFLVRGTCESANNKLVEWTDSCYDSRILNEYSCDYKGECITTSTTCESLIGPGYICSDGACVPPGQNNQELCGYGYCQPDEVCADKIKALCCPKIQPYLCPNNFCVSSEKECEGKGIECERFEKECERKTLKTCTGDSYWVTVECENGCNPVTKECILTKEVCSDTESYHSDPGTANSGQNPFLKGKTYSFNEGKEEIKEDICKKENLLTEYYCEGSEIRERIYDCDGGCENGACKESRNFLKKVFDAFVGFIEVLFGLR